MLRHKPSLYLFAACFLLSFFVFSAWLFSHWPGLFNFDTFADLDAAIRAIYNDWNSYIYIFYLRVLVMPHQNTGMIGLFQITLASTLVSLVFAYLHYLGCSLRVIIPCLLAFVFSPLIGVTNIYYVYDWLFSWSHLMLALLIGILFWRQRYQNYRLSVTALLGLAFFTPFVARQRADALMLLPLIPLVMLLFFKVKRKQWLQFLASYIACIALFYGVFPKIAGVQKSNGAYGLTGVLNPLAAIVANSEHNPATAEERAAIEAVVPYERLIKERSDYDIPVFHNGGVNGPQEPVKFYSAVAKIFLRNFDLFLQNRWQMFYATIGFEYTLYFHDDLLATYPFALAMKEKLQLRRESFNPGLFRFLSAIAHKTLFYPGMWQLVVRTLLLPFLIALIALAAFRKFPSAALVALIILCRVPSVFVFGPSPQFKYLYAVYLSFFFLIPLMALEAERGRP